MDTEMINDKVSQGIMLISAEKYDAIIWYIWEDTNPFSSALL